MTADELARFRTLADELENDDRWRKIPHQAEGVSRVRALCDAIEREQREAEIVQAQENARVDYAAAREWYDEISNAGIEADLCRDEANYYQRVAAAVSARARRLLGIEEG